MQIYPEKEQTYSKVSYNLLLLPLTSPNHEDEPEFLQQSMNPIKDKRSYNHAEFKLLHCVPHLSLVPSFPLCLAG